MEKLLMIWATPFFSDRWCHIRIYNEMKYLTRNGFDVTLTTYHIGNDIPGISVKRIINIPWYKKTSPWASWHKLYLDFLLLLISIKYYFVLKPRVIHAHLYEWLLIAYVIKILSFFRVKIIFDCQWSLAAEMLNYDLWKKSIIRRLNIVFVYIEKFLLFLPDYILCSSENSYNLLIDTYGVMPSKIDVLPDGIDLELFAGDGTDRTDMRNLYWIGINKTVIIYTWWLSKAKWVDILLEAIPNILDRDKNIVFFIAGYGELESVFREMYGKYIKSGNLIFTGRFSYFDLPKLIKISDFAIEPKHATSESSGKIYNYIAWKLPIICLKNEFNHSLLGESGVYVDDFSEIPSAIRDAKRDYIPEIREDVLWKNIIKKYIQLLDTL